MIFEVSRSAASILSERLLSSEAFVIFLLTVIFNIKGELSVDQWRQWK